MTSDPSANEPNVDRPQKARVPVGIRILLRTTVAGLLIAILVGATVTIWFAMSFADANADVEAELEMLRSRGEPATPEELEAFHRLPDGADDVTPLWREAMDVLASDEYTDDAETLPIVGDTSIEIPPPGEAWDQATEVQALLDKYQDPIRKLHEAADRDGSARYEGPPTGPLDTAEIAQDLHRARRLLELVAELAVRQGDGAGALRAIRTQWRLARSVERYPHLITQLSRFAVANQACRTLAAAVPRVTLSNDELRSLALELHRDKFDNGLYLALLGERVSGLVMFDNPAMAIDDELTEFERSSVNQWMRMRKRDRALFLSHMRRLIDATQQPWPGKLDTVDTIEKDLDDVIHGGTFSMVQYMYSALTLPALGRTFVGAGRVKALRDAATVVLVIEIYRNENGELPKTLNDLTPQYISEIPTDAFNGMPLRYLVEPDSYVVYSVGEDGIDNGGVDEEDLDQEGEGTDMGLRISIGDAEESPSAE